MHFGAAGNRTSGTPEGKIGLQKMTVPATATARSGRDANRCPSSKGRSRMLHGRNMILLALLGAQAARRRLISRKLPTSVLVAILK